jgi:RNA polymerase sigma-70 factor (ECF subfamily)
MLPNAPFTELLGRVYVGDAEAAAELVRRYEPAIRLEVRLCLTDHRLRRLVDSMDICQSVLASFFVRAAAGQYDLNRPEQLLRLLVAITRNKARHMARTHRAGRRDYRREVAVDRDGFDVAATEPSPSRQAAGRELLDEFRRRLTEEERQLADLRGQGCEWAEIATRLGGTPWARCKQLARAANRVARELGLEEGRHG